MRLFITRDRDDLSTLITMELGDALYITGGDIMTKKTAGLIHRVYGILLSISIFIAGLCLMAACLGIYDSGNGEFTRQIVA